MLTFTLAICLTTSSLPWFMDLTFQVPMKYCSLQHQTLLLSPVTSKTGYCFCFGSIPSFSLELFLHWSPVSYRALTDLGSSHFSILSFCLFILFMGFSRQEYWSGLPLPSPVEKERKTTEWERLEKIRDTFKKIRDSKGTFHAKMGSIKDRNGMDLTEAEDIKRWQEYTIELYKKNLHNQDNHDGSLT